MEEKLDKWITKIPLDKFIVQVQLCLHAYVFYLVDAIEIHLLT